jgi:hypothetical protein
MRADLMESQTAMTTSAKKEKGSANALTVLETVPTDSAEAREWYVAQIHAVCRLSGIAAGKWLIDAKEGPNKLPHGEFTAMIEDDLPFGPRTAQYLMVIARNEVLSNPKYSSLLPGAWTVLYELALVDEKLGAGTLESWIERGLIHPGIKGREVEDLIEHELALKEEAEVPQARANYVAYLRTLSKEECCDELEKLCVNVDHFGFAFTLRVVDPLVAPVPETGGKSIH